MRTVCIRFTPQRIGINAIGLKQQRLGGSLARTGGLVRSWLPALEWPCAENIYEKSIRPSSAEHRVDKISESWFLK